MNYIKNLESKLSDCNRCMELFRKIHVEMIKQYGIDVRSGDTHSKTYAARYAMLYELKKTGVTDTFLAELLGYQRQSGVSVAMNRIKGYVKYRDKLFMRWHGIVSDILKNIEEEKNVCTLMEFPAGNLADAECHASATQWRYFS